MRHHNLIPKYVFIDAWVASMHGCRDALSCLESLGRICIPRGMELWVNITPVRYARGLYDVEAVVTGDRDEYTVLYARCGNSGCRVEKREEPPKGDACIDVAEVAKVAVAAKMASRNVDMCTSEINRRHPVQVSFTYISKGISSRAPKLYAKMGHGGLNISFSTIGVSLSITDNRKRGLQIEFKRDTREDADVNFSILAGVLNRFADIICRVIRRLNIDLVDTALEYNSRILDHKRDGTLDATIRIYSDNGEKQGMCIIKDEADNSNVVVHITSGDSTWYINIEGHGWDDNVARGTVKLLHMTDKLVDAIVESIAKTLAENMPVIASQLI